MICKNCGSEIADNLTECPFCLIDIDEMVRPMVGGGSHITDFMRI